ncbi:MAG: hypothetical protein PHH54_02150 [Candidatus Nanoarchaeia archaeon]|nr:hypothetical protein [Candidatus Nanoarchaeia archaeon]MDD5740764.1 hypothetical protein [Candidatus Nanoarchaeia archaeon]
MNIQRVKQGAKITLYNGIYTILFGLFHIFLAEYNMKNNFLAIDSIWRLFVKYNPQIYKLFILSNISLGILMVALGVFISYQSYFIIKRKDKLAWSILLVSGTISWIGLLTISVLFRNWILIILSSVGFIMFIFGMLLPISYYLSKNYLEY